MATYTVDRKTWYRGQGCMSRLLLWNGERCCVGFVGQQCGITDGELFNRTTAVRCPDPRWPDYLTSLTGCDAYNINDDQTINDTERESRLTAIFAEHGDTLLFIN